MIISEEKWNELSEEEVKDLMNKYNQEHGTRFYLEDGYFHIGENVMFPPMYYQKGFKNVLRRDHFMTSEEYKSEVLAGKFPGVKVINGKVCY